LEKGVSTFDWYKKHPLAIRAFKISSNAHHKIKNKKNKKEAKEIQSTL